MSFALEFRKKHLIDRPAASVGRQALEQAPGSRAKDAGRGIAAPAMVPNARRVALTLLIAAVVLAVFNSGSLVQYTRGLSDTMLGPNIIRASERWHAMMESGHMTDLTNRIRAVVSSARQSSWEDVARRFGLAAQRRVGDAAGEARAGENAVRQLPEGDHDRPVKPVRRTGVEQSG